MAEIRKEPTKTQKIFRKLNPASWFSRKKETAPSPRSDPLPQLSPELERDFSNMHIGLMMDKLIPVSREYRLGKTGDARKKMDVADALVVRANDSFGAMKSTNNHANPGVAQMYPQHYRNATKNLQDAIQLYAYAAARLADGSDLKSQVSQKIKGCETLLEAINQYHNNTVPGIRGMESRVAFPKTKLTPEEHARVEMARANSLLTNAKKDFDAMVDAPLLFSSLTWPGIVDELCKTASDSATEAKTIYLQAMRDIPDAASPLHIDASSNCEKCEQIIIDIDKYRSNKAAILQHVSVLKEDADSFPYFSSKAPSNARAILEMLSQNKPLAEILTEFSPESGFSKTVSKSVSVIFRVISETPVFENYALDAIAEYCGAVAARGT